MIPACRCCGRLLKKGESFYHPACLRRLFDVPWVPAIPVGLHDFQSQVAQVVAKAPMSLSGVQKKASAQLDRKTRQLHIVSIGGTHILKPEADLFPQMPVVENLDMTMAERAGIEVPPHGLFPMKDGSLCYVVRRFDRLADGTKSGQEDMKQILGTADKYQGSLESIGKVILKYAVHPGLDAIAFFERVVFCFLMGNGDMHLKNWSFTESREGPIRLTPAYDLVSSRLYIPQEEESALTLHGKRNRLQRTDFESLAHDLEIDPKAARASLARLVGMKEPFQQMVQESGLESERQTALVAILSERCRRLSCSPEIRA